MEPMITYETISGVHRAEKGPQLSKLPDGFFPAVRLWLSHKKNRGDTSSILEAENAKKLLEYVVNIRLRKIMTAALDSARGSAPPANMTTEEEAFFDKVLSTVKTQQNEMKERLFGAGFIVEQKMEEARRSVDEMKTTNMEIVKSIGTSPSPASVEKTTAVSVATEKPTGKILETPQQATIADQKALKPLNSTKRVRILMELPRFVDGIGAQYGPFKAGDTADVPEDVFRLLSIRRAAEPTT
jgi:DNA replication initiation complex subunit (GINS family)